MPKSHLGGAASSLSKQTDWNLNLQTHEANVQRQLNHNTGSLTLASLESTPLLVITTSRNPSDVSKAWSGSLHGGPSLRSGRAATGKREELLFNSGSGDVSDALGKADSGAVLHGATVSGVIADSPAESGAMLMEPLSLGSPSMAAKLDRLRGLRLCCSTAGGWSRLSSYRTLYICACSTALANAMTFRCAPVRDGCGKRVWGEGSRLPQLPRAAAAAAAAGDGEEEVESGVAFHLIEQEDLVAAFAALGADLPNRKALAGTMLNKEHDRVSRDVWEAIDALHLGGSYFVTTEPARGVCKNAEWIEELHMRWAKKVTRGNLDRLLGMVMDNTKANRKALDLMKQKHPTWLLLGCQAHALALLIKDLHGEKNARCDWSKKAYGKALMMSNTINGSETIHSALREQQKFKYGKVKAVRSHCPTRFAILHFICSDLLDSEEAIKLMVGDRSWGKVSEGTTHAAAFTTAATVEPARGRAAAYYFFDEAAALKKLVQPVSDAIHQVESDKPLLSQMLPIWKQLLQHAADFDDHIDNVERSPVLPLFERRYNTHFDKSVLGPFLPNYAERRFGSSPAQVGIIMAVYPAFNLLASPWVGYVANRAGRWNMLMAGLALLTCATALYGAAPSVAALQLASALHGTSLSLIHVSSLSLLSSFPARLTEGMAGIEIWSGVGLVLGPPLGGCLYPYVGVPGVFVCLSVLPLLLLVAMPAMRLSWPVEARIKPQPGGAKCAMRDNAVAASAAVAGAKDAVRDDAAAGAPAVPLAAVARARGVLAGALVTAANFGLIGFLEATLSPHLAQALQTTPQSVGFIFIVPSITYSLMAAKTERVVEGFGARRTMLFGFAVLSISLFLFGPAPALDAVGLSPAAVRGAIAAGMLIFQVGSAMACVPAFAIMQGGVAHLGRGADSIVAGVHSLAIGMGEVVGPLLGGFMMEMGRQTRVASCIPSAALSLPPAAVAAETLAAGLGGTSTSSAAATAVSEVGRALSRALRDGQWRQRRRRLRLLQDLLGEASAAAAASAVTGNAQLAEAFAALPAAGAQGPALGHAEPCMSAFPTACTIMGVLSLLSAALMYTCMAARGDTEGSSEPRARAKALERAARRGSDSPAASVALLPWTSSTSSISVNAAAAAAATAAASGVIHV
ncbi:major facilitator superfamily domain-containing protein [Tribonema minus]|uniref:Major facilitator superfamily domain-containing protein n=1 Tax=Tribonema minus TaxID=303371 RepID=A0A836CL52_9STRA|nr:major facilitator superfamily domain-containing protein [Tribonema minus]